MDSFSDLSKQEKDTRLWASVCHFIPLVVVIGDWFSHSLANIWAPALIWLFFRNRDEFVVANARESVNFQIAITSYLVIFFLLLYSPLKVGLIPQGWYYGILVFIVTLALVFVVMMIQASVLAIRGESHRYVLIYRLFRSKSV
ncbi:MAG: DUF4870 domain-containing protein [Bacteroidetes bacterium]|nr:DUF4870 domain-containing protein [Bacteroidota bacterium]